MSSRIAGGGPGLYLEEKKVGIRIEDTILITADGCEVLTSAVPKEIEEIEALMKTGPAESMVSPGDA